MPLQIAALLMALGCAPAEFNGPSGAFVVWVCPPVSKEEPASPDGPQEPPRPPAEERGA